MISDATTFYLAFTTVFGGLAAYLWWLDRRARELETRLRSLELAESKNRPDAAGPDGEGPA